MNSFLLKVQTIASLGIPSLWRVFTYRLGLKLGLNPVHKLESHLIIGKDFFYSPQVIQPANNTCTYLKEINQYRYFDWFTVETKALPNWYKNPFNQQIMMDINTNWWEIADFNPELGDIKTVWEASRFNWVLGFSQWAALGDSKALARLNEWLNDWCVKNAPYKGANWKCGQEASIRVMHLSIAASILNQHNSPSESLFLLIKAHLKRIAPTLSYAIAQNNNHGTSEAAALYIGGSWLYHLGDQSALKYQKIGEKWLVNRAEKLIADDGTFSQYSLNYHRVMLDTYCMAEYWRNLLKLPKFSNYLYKKLSAATNWLYQMTQIETGDAPNLGANDGARLLPLTATDYRDYRPSVQLASVLFDQKRAYKEKGEWDNPLQWLNIKLPNSYREPSDSSDFSSGGYSLLRKNKAFILFNIPRYKFRPSQCDALHLDLWLEGENLLRDGGTFSYNAGDAITQYFGGTASHNTIQFDGRDQMPRLSRFLLGAWLKAKEVIPVTMDQEGNLQTAASYQDYQGAYHHRKVTLTNNKLLVKDMVKGFKQKAILRWRLKPDHWLVDLKKKTLTNGKHEIRIQSEVDIIRFEIVEGWESRYYLQKTPLPVLEVEIVQQGIITTEYHFTV